MKNSLITQTMILCSISLVSLNSFASFQPEFICRATCAVIDLRSKSFYPLQSVTGLSELGTTEAFEDMAQNCRNVAAFKGIQGIQTTLITGVAKVSQYNKNESSKSDSQSTTSSKVKNSLFQLKAPRSIKNGSSSSSSSSYSNTESAFQYEVDFADEANCKPFIQNTNGSPKYIGSENPLG